MNILIPVATVASLSQIILFSILLGLLIILKIYRPEWYENFRWFCTPGVIFLKSWTSLFFFAYLVQLPAEMSSVSPPQIVSWVFQLVFGNIIALGISLGAFALLNYLKSQISNGGVDQVKDTSNDTKPEEPTTIEKANNFRPTYATVEKVYLDQIMTRKSVFATDNFGVELNTETKAFRRTTITPAGMPSMFRRPDTIIRESFERPSDTVMMMDNSRYTLAVSKNRFVAEVNSPTKDTERGSMSHRDSFNAIAMESKAAPITANPMLQPSEAPVSQPAPLPAQLIPLPFIPDMLQLFYIWLRICAACAFANILSPVKWPSAVIGFQISACVVIFISCTFHRMRIVGSLPQWLQLLLQSPVMFTPPAIFLVILSSAYGTSGLLSWQTSLDNFIVKQSVLGMASYGAGNYLTVLLNPAIISLAFSAVEPIITFKDFIPILVPLLFGVCLLVYIFTALLSLLLQSPAVIADPLLVHCVTTPIALAISQITGASQGITAAGTIINAVIAYKLNPVYMDKLGVSDPVTRGVSASVAGTLLGVVALDERKEVLAAGIGMVGYSIATIINAVLMAIPPFESFLVNLA